MKQKLISLDNGLTYHTPADLDPFELNRLWNAVTNAMVDESRAAAYNDKRWKAFDAVLFLDLYLEYADESLTVG